MEIVSSLGNFSNGRLIYRWYFGEMIRAFEGTKGALEMIEP
jgi:hypothetical protein